MDRFTTTHRWIVTGLAAAMSLALIAPVAQAHGGGRYKSRGYGGPRVVQRVVYGGNYGGARAPRYVEHHGSAAPVIAGLVGGFILGAATANGRGYRDEGCDRPSYSYYDPYSRGRYSSTDEYLGRCGHPRHPRVLLVIDTDRNECVRTIRWNGERWNDYDRDYEEDWDD